jgi:hypothetical protein
MWEIVNTSSLPRLPNSAEHLLGQLPTLILVALHFLGMTGILRLLCGGAADDRGVEQSRTRLQ